MAQTENPAKMLGFMSTGGGGRTRTWNYPYRILNPARLPFRHSGEYLNVRGFDCGGGKTSRTRDRSQGVGGSGHLNFSAGARVLVNVAGGAGHKSLSRL